MLHIPVSEPLQGDIRLAPHSTGLPPELALCFALKDMASWSAPASHLCSDKSADGTVPGDAMHRMHTRER